MDLLGSLSDIGPFQFRDDKSIGSLFVITSTVKKSFEMVLLAVSQKWPVLLYGPAGVGKTALISKLAHDTGNQGILTCQTSPNVDMLLRTKCFFFILVV